MPEEKPKQNSLDDPEITRLRDVVLDWIEKSKKLNPLAKESETKTTDRPEKLKPAVVAAIKNPITQVKAVLPVKPLNRPVEKPPTQAPAEVKPPVTLAPKKNQSPSQNLLPTKPQAKPALGRWKKLTKKIIGLSSAVIIFSLIGLLTTIYGFGLRNSVTLAIAQVLPLPAAVVNLQPITIKDWDKQVETLKNFYYQQATLIESSEVPTSSQVEKHTLERMIDNLILEQAAKKYEITIQPAEIDKYLKTLSDEIGSQAALEAQIENLYHWTLEDFKQEIVRPLLLKSHLATAVIVDDRINHQARLTAETALAEVTAAVLPFETLAQKYSEDVTALQGGDLGYFSQGQLEPAFEQAAFALKPGQVSEIVQTKFGFHIIKVEEALLDENDKVIQIRAKHILIRGKDLDAFLAETKKDAMIWRLIRLK